jgi:DNA-binding transcriptional LysR family regulator
MRREDLVDLNTFLTVAEECSFTRAAKKLGTSQSAVSSTVRRMEERVGVRLLIRTTRKVALTEAGERLLGRLGPALGIVSDELNALAELRDKPSGTVRITTSEHAARTILWPAAKRLMAAYPEVQIEISIEAALTDIVAHRFDAGIRLGEHVAKDMIAMRIGPDVRMAAVAAPGYLAKRPAPVSPHDLAHHACINIRTPTHGGLYAWEFEKKGREVRVRVEGQFTCNSAYFAVEAAKAGFGIAFVP